jgi:hypothetical protein
VKPESILTITKPYYAEAWDGIFADEVCQEMLAKFPLDRMREFSEYRGGLKYHFNQSHEGFADFIADTPVWKLVLAEDRIMSLGQGLSDSWGFTQIELKRAKIEFSALPYGGGLLPHPDGAEKVMTAIIYLPDKDWHPTWGGEFEICRHKSVPRGDFARQHIPWEDVETVSAVPLRLGRMIAFKRTPWSLHGVRPVRPPAGRFRKSVTINWIA